MKRMQRPNKEQILFSQLAIAQGIIEYIEENIDDTIFKKNHLDIIAQVLLEGFEMMREEMLKSFNESEEIKNVCY
jgi:cobalamin-dependent methionine synthase I